MTWSVEFNAVSQVISDEIERTLGRELPLVPQRSASARGSHGSSGFRVTQDGLSEPMCVPPNYMRDDEFMTRWREVNEALRAVDWDDIKLKADCSGELGWNKLLNIIAWSTHGDGDDHWNVTVDCWDIPRFLKIVKHGLPNAMPAPEEPQKRAREDSELEHAPVAKLPFGAKEAHSSDSSSSDDEDE